jgi:DNA-binding transcriptional MerR regulator
MRYKKLTIDDIQRVINSIKNAQHEHSIEKIKQHLTLLELGGTVKKASMIQKIINDGLLQIDKPTKMLAFYRGFRNKTDNQMQIAIDEKLDQINEMLDELSQITKDVKDIEKQIDFQIKQKISITL